MVSLEKLTQCCATLPINICVNHWHLYTAETTTNKSEKYVVVLSYQRCGSSFVGEAFNRNPYAFYAFEPLDSLYTALYGTSPGWNVPSDITNNKDGTVR